MLDACNAHCLLIFWCMYLSHSAIDARPMKQHGLLDNQASLWFGGDQFGGNTTLNSALREPRLQKRIPSSLIVSALPTLTTPNELQATTKMSTLQSFHWTLTDPSNQTPTLSPSTTLNDTTSNKIIYGLAIFFTLMTIFIISWGACIYWYLRKSQAILEATFANGQSPTDDSGPETNARRHNLQEKELKAAIDHLFPVRTFSGTVVIHVEPVSVEHFKSKEKVPKIMGETFEIEEIEEKVRCDKSGEDILGDDEAPDDIQAVIGKYEDRTNARLGDYTPPSKGQNTIEISPSPLEMMGTNAPDSPPIAAETSSATQAPVPSTAHQRDNDPCTICLDDWLEGDLIRDLPCSHQFHARCLDSWFLMKEAVCPNCKRNYEPALDSIVYFGV